jgi:hypothetical protein
MIASTKPIELNLMAGSPELLLRTGEGPCSSLGTNGQPDRIASVVLSTSTYYSDMPGGFEENLDKPKSDVLSPGRYLNPEPAKYEVGVFNKSSATPSFTDLIREINWSHI